MKYEVLTPEESDQIAPGEALTVSAVLAIVCVAVIAVVVYKLFTSNKGSATVGGWKFSWA